MRTTVGTTRFLYNLMCLDEIIGCLRLHISKTTKKVDEKKAENWKKILMGLAMFSHSFTLTKSYNMGKMVTYLKKKTCR